MSTQKHVIVAGFGRSGQSLATLLTEENIAYHALDLDPERVQEAQAAGANVSYGDAGRRESLIAAGIYRASAVVITYASTPSALRVLHLVHELAPALPVIVRSYDDTDLDRLKAAGAAEVVPELMEGSLMLASHALVMLGVPLRRVVHRVQAAREARYASLRGWFHGASDAGEDADLRRQGAGRHRRGQRGRRSGGHTARQRWCGSFARHGAGSGRRGRAARRRRRGCARREPVAGLSCQPAGAVLVPARLPCNRKPAPCHSRAGGKTYNACMDAQHGFPLSRE
jgi:voltage-gated potassium channel Kch